MSKELQIPNSIAPIMVSDPGNSGFSSLLLEEGYILGRWGDQLLRYKTDAHLISVGPTGTGKGTGLIIPNLMDHMGSAFVIDIRGETLRKTAEARRHLGQRVIVLDPFNIEKGKWGKDTYNPFDLFFSSPNEAEGQSRVGRLVRSIMFDPEGRSSNEPIWDNATKELLYGLLHLCLWYWPPYKQNLLEVYDILLFTPQEREIFIAELKALIENDLKAQKDRTLKSLLHFLTHDGSTTKVPSNAIVQAKILLQWMQKEHFKEITQESTFSFEKMQGDQKMTVYLVVPEEHIDDCTIWIRMILENAIFSQKNITGRATSELKQKDRVLFLLDEVAQFGKLDIVSKGMSTLRGRGVNLWLFLQNLGQLNDIYGKDNTRAIIDNAAVLQIFGSNDTETKEYLVRTIGEDFFDVSTVSIGITNTEGENRSYATQNQKTSSRSITTSNQTGISDAKGQTRTTNQGISLGRSSSYNTGNRNWLSGTNTPNTKTRTGNHQINWGRSRANTSTKTHTVSITEGSSIQKGYSHGTTETIAYQKSRASMQQISVTRQRMNIETVRSITGYFNRGEQFIRIRKHHPFFCTCMSYHVKYSGRRYVFPDMAAMAEAEIFTEIATRKALTEPLPCDILQETSVLQSLELADETENLEILNTYRKTLSEDILKSENLRTLEDQLFEHKNDLGEAAVAALGMIVAMKRMKVPEFETIDEELVNRMRRIEEAAEQETVLESDFFKKFEGIQAVFKELEPSKIPVSRRKFLISLYAPVIAKFKTAIEEEKNRLLLQIQCQEESRLWLKQSIELIQFKRDEALMKAVEREEKARTEFMLNRRF